MLKIAPSDYSPKLLAITKEGELKLRWSQKKLGEGLRVSLLGLEGSFLGLKGGIEGLRGSESAFSHITYAKGK